MRRTTLSARWTSPSSVDFRRRRASASSGCSVTESATTYWPKVKGSKLWSILVRYFHGGESIGSRRTRASARKQPLRNSRVRSYWPWPPPPGSLTLAAVAKASSRAWRRRIKEEDFIIETSQSLAHASGSLCHRVQSLEYCALVSLRQI